MSVACMTITLQHKFPTPADKLGDPKLVRTLEQNMSFNFNDNSDDLWNEFNDGNTSWERKAAILLNLASLQAHEGNWSLELEYIRNAVEIAKSHDLRKIYFDYLNILSARAMHGKEDYELALSAADEVLAALPGFQVEIDAMEWTGTAYCNRGRALMGLDRYDEAIPALRAGLDYAELIKDLPETAHTNLGLMRCFIEVDRLDLAKVHGSAARAIYRDRSQLGSLCETDRLFAKISLLEGNPVQAKDELKEVRALEQRMFSSSNPETKIILGLAYMELGQYERAERLFDRIVDKAIQGWIKDLRLALKALDYLCISLEAQGKVAEAARAALQREALSSRTPGPEVKKTGLVFKEIQALRKSGKYDLAKIRCQELQAEADKAGDIQLHWKAVFETAITLRNDKDYAGVLALWDGQSLNCLEYQDDVVICFKNIVTHAMQKCDRYEEALDLNKQVLNDSRTQIDKAQLGFALENAARINKDLAHTKAANKFKEQTLVHYLAEGENQRALELIEYFKKK